MDIGFDNVAVALILWTLDLTMLLMSDLSVRFPVFGGRGRYHIGKRKSAGPSDALALHLCSEIAQGPVKYNPPWWQISWVPGPGREP